MLGRAVALLAAFTADDPTLGLAELTRRTGLPKSTVHRLACELVRLGMLERFQDEFRPGMRLFELGQLAPRQRDLREAALPFMTDLRDATRETVHLAVLDDREVVYIEILHSNVAPPLPSRVGGRLPAHSTGVGKALLAFSGPETLARILAEPLARRTARTIVMPGRLRAELQAIHSRGVAYDREEAAEGVICAACPVFAGDGQVVAGLSVSGRPGHLNLDRVAPAVRTAASGLTRTLSRSRGSTLRRAPADRRA